MNTYKYISRLIGLLLLAVAIIFVLSVPSTIFSRNISFIYPSLSNPGAGQTSVQTKMDFGDQEHVESFPLEIGEWRGQDYDLEEAEKMRDQLGADVLVMRDYYRPGLWRGLTFLIMQSESQASFHPPQVCYPASGWKVLEEGEEEIPMPASFWEDIGDLGPLGKNRNLEDYVDPVRMSKLVITVNREAGETYDRHVVLYCYVRDNTRWGGSDAVTMLRVSAPTTLSGSYDDMLQIEKEFLADIMPLMFQAREKEDTMMTYMLGLGPGGVVLLVFMFTIPFVVAFHPDIGNFYRRKRSPPPAEG